MKTKESSHAKFLLKLTSGWKDLIASLLVLGLGGTRFFWLAFLSFLNFSLHIHLLINDNDIRMFLLCEF